MQELKKVLGDNEDSSSGSTSLPRRSAFQEDSVDSERREKVKEAMLHAWNSYVQFAWGQDELQVSYELNIYHVPPINHAIQIL